MELVLLCLKIFVARIFDVSLGTARMILVIKEKKLLATITAFFEVLIWFMVAREALSQATKFPIIVIAYAGGFAAGTLIGTILSNKFIEGKLNVQIISTTNSLLLLDKIKENGFGASAIKMHDDKLMIITEVDKNKYNCLKKIINEIDFGAFVYVNETKFVEGGFFQKK